MLPAVIPVERRKEYISDLNTENLAALTAFAEELQQLEAKRYQGRPEAVKFRDTYLFGSFL